MEFDTEQDSAARPADNHSSANRREISRREIENSRNEILDSYLKSRILSGLCYLYPQSETEINFTGFGKQFSAGITYVKNESHLGMYLKEKRHDFIILDSANGRSDYTRLFGSICHTFGKYRPTDKPFPVSIIDETDKMRKGFLYLGESFGLKVVFGTRNGNTIDTNLAKILEEN